MNDHEIKEIHFFLSLKMIFGSNSEPFLKARVLDQSKISQKIDAEINKVLHSGALESVFYLSFIIHTCTSLIREIPVDATAVYLDRYLY